MAWSYFNMIIAITCWGHATHVSPSLNPIFNKEEFFVTINCFLSNSTPHWQRPTTFYNHSLHTFIELWHAYLAVSFYRTCAYKRMGSNILHWNSLVTILCIIIMPIFAVLITTHLKRKKSNPEMGHIFWHY